MLHHGQFVRWALAGQPWRGRWKASLPSSTASLAATGFCFPLCSSQDPNCAPQMSLAPPSTVRSASASPVLCISSTEASGPGHATSLCSKVSEWQIALPSAGLVGSPVQPGLVRSPAGGRRHTSQGPGVVPPPVFGAVALSSGAAVGKALPASLQYNPVEPHAHRACVLFF